VPQAGYGSAGEIISLAHAFGPLIGVGAALSGSSTGSAASALSAAGRVPIVLGPKEGIALLQGVPGATARAVLLVEDARQFLDQAITVLPLGLHAAAAPRDPFQAALARGDDELAAISARIRDRLVGCDGEPR